MKRRIQLTMDDGATTLGGLPYAVIIAGNASEALARTLAGSQVRRAVLFYDRRAAATARRMEQGVRAVGIDPIGSFEVRGGERLKRLRELSGLYEKLVGSGADRRTCIVAVGGGTVTDAAGFAAATYMRGLAWAAVPTTILAMVDAAIGGKTGIDLPEGKNLVGAFWNPLVVAADLDSLGSLPAKQRRTGLAEIIKAAIVGDAELFQRMESFSPRARPAAWREAIVAAARVKIAVVAGDPRDSGGRAVLNLGHTVGHALEYASGFRLPHGEAVAVGLRAEGMLAMDRGWWSAQLQSRLLRLLRRCSLPAHASGLSTEKVVEGMRRDKKRTGGIHRFALPVRLGEVKAGVEINETDIRRVVAACAEPPMDTELSA